MSIEDHLLEGESILAQCQDKKSTFYVTDKRYIKHSEGGMFGREVFHDISLEEVTGFSLVRIRGSLNLVIFGIVLLVIGYLWNDIIKFIFPFGYFGIISYILLGSGVSMIILGLIYKRSYFQFKGPGILTIKDESEVWQLGESNRYDINNFIRTARKVKMINEK